MGASRGIFRLQLHPGRLSPSCYLYPAVLYFPLCRTTERSHAPRAPKPSARASRLVEALRPHPYTGQVVTVILIPDQRRREHFNLSFVTPSGTVTALLPNTL